MNRFFVGLLLLVLLTASVADCKAATNKHSADVVILRQLNAYVKTLMPVVEKAAGRKFKSVPKILISKPPTQTSVQGYDSTFLAVMLPQYSGKQYAEAHWSTMKILAASQFAWTSWESHCIYFAPSALAVRIKEKHIDPRQRNDMIKLALAHEMVHLLEYQWASIDKLEKACNTHDERYAAVAVAEGFAMFVEEKVAQKLGVEAMEQKILSSIGVGWKDSGDQLAQFVRRATYLIGLDTYIGGKAFVKWHYNKGGNEKIWQILMHPAASSSMIIRPDTYAAKSQVSKKTETVLVGVDRSLAERAWTTYFFDLGEIQLRAEYLDMKPATRDAVLASLKRCQCLGANSGESSVAACLVELKDASLIKPYITELDQMCLKYLKGTSQAVKIKDVTFSSFDAIKADFSSKSSFLAENMWNSFTTKIVRIGRGRFILELYLRNLDVPDQKIAEVAEAIFAKLPSDMTAVSE